VRFRTCPEVDSTDGGGKGRDKPSPSISHPSLPCRQLDSSLFQHIVYSHHIRRLPIFGFHSPMDFASCPGCSGSCTLGLQWKNSILLLLVPLRSRKRVRNLLAPIRRRDGRQQRPPHNQKPQRPHGGVAGVVCILASHVSLPTTSAIDTSQPTHHYRGRGNQCYGGGVW